MRQYWVCLFACLTVLASLAGCGSNVAHHARVQRNPSRYYPPPGPSGDPWGPYIHEASGRFGVPELWIRGVMRQESGGQEDVISWAGAMGLMQVMPDTYDGLRGRYGLGDDPFDPHNNILAGTAYLREMYDRFGSPGFLAAYNAGPNRLDAYLSNGRALPSETVSYVASIAPRLGAGTPMSGPLAAYAGQIVASSGTPAGCDRDAAYNPNGPCTPLRPAVVVASAAAAPVVDEAARDACDADAAYDPTRPCRPVPGGAVSGAAVSGPAVSGPAYEQAGCDPDAAYDPTHPCRPVPAGAPAIGEQALPPPQVVAQALPPPAIVAQALPPPRIGDQALPPLPAIGEQTLPPLPARQSGYAAPLRPLQERMTQRAAFSPGPPAFSPGPPAGRWAIQVGAFANLASAQAAAESARSAVPDLLRTAKIELPATTPFGSQVAFRARLFGLSAAAAADSCARLSGRGVACLTVPPMRDSF